MIAKIVAADNEELNMGWLQWGSASVYAPGIMSTPRPNMIDKPTTNVFRESIMRDMIICNPAMIMKATAKMSIAPMTGSGMMAKIDESLGQNAKMISRPPVAKAMTRQVAPVAMESPTFVDEVDCPMAPKSPAHIQPIESAKMPFFIFFISERFHSTSLIF